MKKYSGTLGDYSGFNSLLIGLQDPNATIVRSRNEWKYFGWKVKDDALPLLIKSILRNLGISSIRSMAEHPFAFFKEIFHFANVMVTTVQKTIVKVYFTAGC